MKIYRLENKDGRGPYVTGDMGIVSIRCGGTRKPEPSEEKEFDGHHVHSLKFGFASVEQFDNWFSHRQQIHLVNFMKYHLVVYEVPETSVIVSASQAGFYPDKAEKIAIYSSMAEINQLCPEEV